MKIDKKTIETLENFSRINPSLLITPGNVLRTVDQKAIIFSITTVPDVFPKRVAIFDLSKLIATLSILPDADLTFNDDFLEIKKDSTIVKYRYCDEDCITFPSQDNLEIKSIDSSFKLPYSVFQPLFKGLHVLGLPEYIVSGDGKNIHIAAANSTNPASPSYNVKIGETDKKFKAIFKSEHLKLLPIDYTVDICDNGYARFTGENTIYWAVVQYNSSF